MTDWNAVVKQSVAEHKRQAELEAWWNKPVAMPKPPPPEKPGTLEYLDYGINIPSLYAKNTPAENVSVQSNSERAQSVFTCSLIAFVILAVGITLVVALWMTP